MASGPPPVLSVEGLETRYGSVPAVKGVSLEVGAGDLVGVIGPNGAGKTTTLQSIMGLLRPAAGRVRFEGRDLKVTKKLAVVK